MPQLVPFKEQVATLKSQQGRLTSEVQRNLPISMRQLADRIVTIAISACIKNPELLKCDRQSLYNAIVQASQLGLIPDGPQQQCHLVPFKGKVQLIPGYRGLIELATRSGKVLQVNAYVIREGDHVEHRQGTDPCLTHVVPMNGTRGPVTHAYATAEIKDSGRLKFEVLDLDDLAKIQKAAPGSSKPDSPWQKWWVEQAKKSAIKRLCKTLPSSGELGTALALDDRHEMGEEQELPEAMVTDETPPEAEEQQAQGEVVA